MKNEELFNEDHRATYCPEDDKLRLYVGRVPREEYQALRAEGWTSTPKQDCDFVAVWSVARENTALSYAGIVEDEDAGPEERAADRAERFAGYREKRISDATGHADRYDAGPQVHGFQNEKKAEKAAARHDRQASRAVNAWDKAEYWQSRTAGVISNALYKSSPGVRMGRIKTIETDLRRAEKRGEEYAARYAQIEKMSADPAGAIASMLERVSGDDREAEAERLLCEHVAGYGKHRNPANHETAAGYYFEHMKSDNPPTLADYCRDWLATSAKPGDPESASARYINHLKLRLAYEEQMLEAQGGRAAYVEMIPGGFLGGHQVHKVNKSPKTGRVVSVSIKVRTNGKDRWGNEDPNAPEFRLENIKTERLAESAYRAPTDEELAQFKKEQSDQKKTAKQKAKANPKPSLINPTLEEAERLQALINSHHENREPGEVVKLTQSAYSAASKGSYARAETVHFCANGKPYEGGHTMRGKLRAARLGPILCKLRVAGYGPYKVIHLTDKPTKALPAEIWEAYKMPEHQTREGLAPRAPELALAVNAACGHAGATDEQKELLENAALAGLVHPGNITGHYHWTDDGYPWAQELGAFQVASTEEAKA